MIETIPTALSLPERLRDRIRRDGPMTFCDWMNAALYDESNGYYQRAGRKPWGREGDYRTSPERSGLFAATFARYFANLYDKLNQPSEWTIVEAGAGDGTFACGLLQTLQDFFPRVFLATRYVIDEVGPRATMRKELEPFADRISFAPISGTILNPGIIFSNELLDAFPVHRVTMQKGQVLEYYVDVATNGNFVWSLAAPSTPRLIDSLEKGETQLAEGEITEISLAIEDWFKGASNNLKTGYLVTVDYGSSLPHLHSRFTGDGTLRGFKNHSFVNDVLARPGEQDLTSSVNWHQVQKVSHGLGLKTLEFERQDKFLLSAGLLTQLQLESDRILNESDRLRLTTAAREMILPDGMAASFQVLVQEKAFKGEGAN